VKGTNKAHENGEAMGFVGVRLTDQLGDGFNGIGVHDGVRVYMRILFDLQSTIVPDISG
jgi:hypothetical protein